MSPFDFVLPNPFDLHEDGMNHESEAEPVIVINRTRSDQATVVRIRMRFPRTRRERGAAAVEMAIVMPLLVGMIIGIIDFSRIFNAELQLSQAAREGARIASLMPAPTDTSAIQMRAVLAAPNPAFGAPLSTSGVTVPTTCPATANATNVAEVVVTYQFQGIFWMNGKWLTQKAVMRCGG